MTKNLNLGLGNNKNLKTTIEKNIYIVKQKLINCNQKF
jgi:hypothetical protein